MAGRGKPPCRGMPSSPSRCRGRRPRRPVSAAVPRCEAPSGRGLSAQPTGGEKNAGHLSLRQRFALIPPSQREERGDGFPRQCSHWLGMTGSTAALRAMHAASALSYTGAGEGYTVRRCGGGSWFLGICALGLGLGILIAAVFPVGCLMFLVAFLLIACGVACLRDRR